MRKWTIYMYTFPNGKKYIGATTRTLFQRQGSIEKKWSKYKRCKLLYEAILKYGTDNIQQDILFQGEIADEEAGRLESYYIEKYKTNVKKYNNPSYGYNQTNGGEGVKDRPLTEERKAELQKQMKTFHDRKRGTHASDETRKRLSESHLGQLRGIMPMDTREKISKTNRIHELKPKRTTTRGEQLKIPVIMENLVTGEKRMFDSSASVGLFFDVSRGTVTRWIKGDRRPPKGYAFTQLREEVTAI